MSDVTSAAETHDILIWGAGAIGATVGAAMLRAGFDVTFVDVVESHVEAIRDKTKGLHITGPVEDYTVIGDAFLPTELHRKPGQWRRIFLAVKAQHTAAACEALMPYMAEDAYVLSLQNGLCEKTIAPIVGPHNTMGAFVNFGADWIAPGEVLYGNRGAVVVGEIDGTISERARQLHHDLQSAFEPDAILTDNVWAYLWGKMGYVSLLFAQAVGEKGIADCLERPELFDLWRELAAEPLRVAKAEGVAALGFNGFDPAAFQEGASTEAALKSVAAMVAFNRPNAKTHSGIWRDLAVRKRKTEVDMQPGAVVALGASHGLACPKLQALIDMIHEIEEGKRALSDDNLLELAKV